jgi:hypothetical protein
LSCKDSSNLDLSILSIIFSLLKIIDTIKYVLTYNHSRIKIAFLTWRGG